MVSEWCRGCLAVNGTTPQWLVTVDRPTRTYALAQVLCLLLLLPTLATAYLENKVLYSRIPAANTVFVLCMEQVDRWAPPPVRSSGPVPMTVRAATPKGKSARLRQAGACRGRSWASKKSSGSINGANVEADSQSFSFADCASVPVLRRQLQRPARAAAAVFGSRRPALVQ